MTALQTIDQACDRIRSGESLETAVTWVYNHCMTDKQKVGFDLWLVSIGHRLAWEAGTSEYRFREMVREFATRYGIFA